MEQILSILHLRPITAPRDQISISHRTCSCLFQTSAQSNRVDFVPPEGWKVLLSFKNKDKEKLTLEEEKLFQTEERKRPVFGSCLLHHTAPRSLQRRLCAAAWGPFGW